MKVVQINTTCGVGSIGKICIGISQCMTDNEIENYIIYSAPKSNYPLGICCSSSKYIKLQALKAHFLGNFGFNSVRSTKKIIKELDRIQPDIVQLHNIHSHDCNLKLLFEYIKETKIKVFWTFHDCWAFTAYCPHFTIANCQKWETACKKCPQYRQYSFFFDRSYGLFRKKQALLHDLDLTIVTPSQWLADLVKSSFLKDYPVKVINNGIDLSVFRPTESDFRNKYGIHPQKRVLLGVAFDWGIRKGLDVFIELSDKLDFDRYQIVLVGTNEKIDKQLPKEIISIHRTQNQHELAEIYSAADVLINPTREDNFPTVNIESLACGTPVITFNTGGSPEIIDETCGSVICSNDINDLIKEIQYPCFEIPYLSQACQKRAIRFRQDDKYQEYVNLYRGLV